MEELVIRPTMKFVRLGYLAVIVLFLAALAVQSQIEMPAGWPGWAIPGVFLLVLIWPASRHLARQFTRMTMVGDKLRYETGMLSKSTRTIQLSKVQDVTVRQSLAQRMAGVGDLSIETAGESSRLTFSNIDQPQAIADRIIDASHRIGVRGILDEREEAPRKSGPDHGGEQGSGKGNGPGAGGGRR
jgi:uncharacterized membrane protein YdbT with pleckstrin-like domain